MARAGRRGVDMTCVTEHCGREARGGDAEDSPCANGMATPHPHPMRVCWTKGPGNARTLASGSCVKPFSRLLHHSIPSNHGSSAVGP